MSLVTEDVVEFNSNLLDFLTQLYKVTDNDEILGYQKKVEKLTTDAVMTPTKDMLEKPIEQFVIYALPNADKIGTDIGAFFRDYKVGDKKGVLEEMILKFRDVYPTLSEKNQGIVSEYFQVLTYYGQEYFKKKYAHLM